MITKIGRSVLWAMIALGGDLRCACAHGEPVVVAPGDPVFVPLVLLGLYDFFQPRHSILRNYPLAGRMRFLLEGMGPELHQYLVENDTDGRPFDRDTRSVIYERAKNVGDKKPFGTEQDVYDAGYTLAEPLDRPAADGRGPRAATCGSPSAATQCTQPYSASVLNISAMSFGALGAGRGARDEPRAPRPAASPTTPARAASRVPQARPAAT